MTEKARQFRKTVLAALHERGVRIAELEAEIAAHKEHLRSAMLGIGGADEAPCSRCLPLQTEVVRQAARIAELEAACRDAYSAIKTLPDGALGIGGYGLATHWSLRDELLDVIDDALGRPKEAVDE